MEKWIFCPLCNTLTNHERKDGRHGFTVWQCKTCYRHNVQRDEVTE